MQQTQTFDPDAFKARMRREWGPKAAPGWFKWYDVLEGERAGRVQTRTLLELAGIGPGDAVLDVATGYGEPGLTAARAVESSGRVVLSDIAPEMLEYARKRAADAGAGNVEFLEAAAEDLRFEDETFDAIISRHGLQFVVDVPGTLRRFHSFLKRDGRFAAIVWGPPQKVGFALAVPVIGKELQLPPPPQGQPGIFALADAEALARTVETAGFRDVATGTVPVVYETASPEQWTQLIRDISAPITALVEGQPADVQERVWRKVTEAWAPFTTADGTTRVPCEALWVAGTK